MIGFCQQSLFSHDLSNSIVATKDPNKTIVLEVNALMHQKILCDSPESFTLELPFFNQNILLHLEKFKINSTTLEVISKNDDGDSKSNIIPTILSYKIIYNENSIGIMNFYNSIINESFNLNNQQFEIVD